MKYTTVCPRNCYSTCSLIVTAENGRIVEIEAHPENKATASGICLKGLSYIERAAAPDRILQPQKFNKQIKRFEPISWEEALTIIAEKLTFFKEKYGSQSVLFYTGSGMSGVLNDLSASFWKLYGGATRTYGNLCWPAGLEATRLTFGEIKHNAPWDIENARLIIMWGKNPGETNIQQLHHIYNGLDKGARLIVIDPRRTITSERAEALYRIKPGTDAALALCIASILINQGHVNRTFIDKHVKGFDEFAEHVKKYTPEETSKITEIPEKNIHKLAELIGTETPMTIVPGYGMQRSGNGGQTMRALAALQIITGNIGKKGACWHYADLQSYIFDSVKEPLCYYPSADDSPFRRIVSMASIGADIQKASNPEIKMAWIERGNPVTQNPDTNETIRALQKLDFVVAVDQFLTDTARMADIILPAKNMFEQSDLVGSYWNPYIQLRQKITEPAGMVKPETEIYYLLAQKMGFSRENIDKYLLPPNDEAVETYLRKKLSAFPKLNFDELKKRPLLAPGSNEIAFHDLVFPTPSGKIELYSEQAEKMWGVSPLPDYVPVIKNISQYPLHLLTPNCKNRIHSQFNNLKSIQKLNPEPLLMMNPYDAMQRGINHKDKVNVIAQTGSLTLKAFIDAGIKKGCVSVTNGWWISQGGTPNFLIKARFTDMGYGTAFYDESVEVIKIKK